MNKKQLLLLSSIFWIPVLLFSYIAGEILERQPILFDSTIMHWIHAHSSRFLDMILLVITTIGNVVVILPIALLICGLLWWRHQKRSLFIVAGSFIGAAAANFILKLIFHRQRPAFWESAIHETGYSFPSGHAMVSSALVFSLIVISWNTRWRWYAVFIGLIFVGLVGYSRLYLGVHYPTDIIAGWLASAVWVSVLAASIINHGSLRHKLSRLFHKG